MAIANRAHRHANRGQRPGNLGIRKEAVLDDFACESPRATSARWRSTESSRARRRATTSNETAKEVPCPAFDPAGTELRRSKDLSPERVERLALRLTRIAKRQHGRLPSVPRKKARKLPRAFDAAVVPRREVIAQHEHTPTRARRLDGLGRSRRRRGRKCRGICHESVIVIARARVAKDAPKRCAGSRKAHILLRET